MDLRLGQLVQSKAGRDEGKLFVVVEIDQRYCQVADGRLRQIENPKWKNKKHLQPLKEINNTIARALEAGRRPTNIELREAIKKLNKL